MRANMDVMNHRKSNNADAVVVSPEQYRGIWAMVTKKQKMEELSNPTPALDLAVSIIHQELITLSRLSIGNAGRVDDSSARKLTEFGKFLLMVEKYRDKQTTEEFNEMTEEEALKLVGDETEDSIFSKEQEDLEHYAMSRSGK
jgi:hypothetical protein